MICRVSAWVRYWDNNTDDLCGNRCSRLNRIWKSNKCIMRKRKSSVSTFEESEIAKWVCHQEISRIETLASVLDLPNFAGINASLPSPPLPLSAPVLRSFYYSLYRYLSRFLTSPSPIYRPAILSSVLLFFPFDWIFGRIERERRPFLPKIQSLRPGGVLWAAPAESGVKLQSLKNGYYHSI